MYGVWVSRHPLRIKAPVGTRPVSVMNCTTVLVVKALLCYSTSSEGTDLSQFLHIILCLVVLPVSLVFWLSLVKVVYSLLIVA